MKKREEIQTLADIAEFNPKLDPKYSPNLFRWMKHHLTRGAKFSVYRSTDPDQKGRLWIGFKTGCGVVAVPLPRAMTTRKEALAWSYPGMVRIDGWFSSYKKGGRCFIDPDHTQLFADERWATKGKRRTCLWCGLKQNLREWEEVITVQRTDWVTAPHRKLEETIALGRAKWEMAPSTKKRNMKK